MIIANPRAIEVIQFHAVPSQLDLGLGITPENVAASAAATWATSKLALALAFATVIFSIAIA
jgi:hypothetical protein